MSDQNSAPQAERRASARFLHDIQSSALPSQLPAQFELFITRTDLVYPDSGSNPPRTKIPSSPVPSGEDPQKLLELFRETMRQIPIPEQIIHVTKPHMDLRGYRVVPMVLGRTKILGLESDREDEKSVYIRKPPKMHPELGDPDALKAGEVVLMGYSSSPGLRPGYQEMIAEVFHIASEHITLRARYIRPESGKWVNLIDFSASGVRIAADDELIAYLTEDCEASPEDPIAAIRHVGIRLTLYPVRSSIYGADMFRTDLPMKVSLLGQIVRADLVDSGEGPKVKSLGIKFTYDPSAFSLKSYDYEKWTRIRETHPSPYFSTIHNVLTGRKKHTLSDPELFERAKKLFERSKLRRRANARWLIQTTLQLADQKRIEIDSDRDTEEQGPGADGQAPVKE